MTLAVGDKVKATTNLGSPDDEAYVTEGTEGKIVEVDTDPHPLFTYMVVFDDQGDDEAWPVFADEVDRLDPVE